MQWYHRPNSYTRSDIPARPKPDSIDETKSGKPHLQAAIVSTCYIFPRKRCGRLATLYKISGVKREGKKENNLKDREAERKKEE